MDGPGNGPITTRTPLTRFNEVVVCVVSKKAVGEEGNNGVDWGHVQYAKSGHKIIHNANKEGQRALTFVVAAHGLCSALSRISYRNRKERASAAHKQCCKTLTAEIIIV